MVYANIVKRKDIKKDNIKKMILSFLVAEA